jgi:hypothetical protein
MAAPKKPAKGGKSLKANKDPYIKGAGPTKFNAKDVAMGDPNGKIQKFDPKAFDKMRGDITRDQAQAKRIASRVPTPKAKPAPDPLATKGLFGLGSRRKMANKLQGSGDPNGKKGKCY